MVLGLDHRDRLAVSVAIFLLAGATPETWVDNPDPKAGSPRWRASIALADTALLVVAASLMTGPIRVLAGRRPSVHRPTRRRFVVVGALFGCAYLIVGLSIHGDLGRPWQSFLTGWPSPSDPLPIRISALLLANWVGLSVAAIFLGLTVISNDGALRRLGPRRWKWIQRGAYLAFAAIGMHVVLYQRVEHRWVVHQAVTLAVVCSVLGLQATAFVVIRRRQARTRTIAP